MTGHEHSIVEDEITHYCEVHPERETELRCNKCERYMCVECAVRTPVGYRCRECDRQQQDTFFQATNNDSLIVAATCAILTGIAALIITQIRLPVIFVLLLGFPAGSIIGEIALRFTKRRRGRYSDRIATASTVIGGALGAMLNSYSQLQALVARQFGPGAQVEIPFDLVIQGAFDLTIIVFIAIAAVSVYGRFQVRI